MVQRTSPQLSLCQTALPPLHWGVDEERREGGREEGKGGKERRREGKRKKREGEKREGRKERSEGGKEVWRRDLFPPFTYSSRTMYSVSGLSNTSSILMMHGWRERGRERERERKEREKEACGCLLVSLKHSHDSFSSVSSLPQWPLDSTRAAE